MQTNPTLSTCNWIALETETKLKTAEINARRVELIHAYLSYLTKHKFLIKQNMTSNEANQAIYPIFPFLPHASSKLEHKKKIDEKFVPCCKHITNYSI